jgi:hypothetical protein
MLTTAEKRLRFTAKTVAEARLMLDLIERASFRAFEQTDFLGFAGVQSADPRIAEVDAYILVSDMNRVEIYNADAVLVGRVTFDNATKVEVLR